jgi:predicted metal-binding membrane protein
VTIATFAHLHSMGEMPMPARGRVEATASFFGMWAVMSVVMMLPSAAPALWRVRQAVVRAKRRHPGLLTTCAGLGYFFVWIAAGTIALPLGATLAAIRVELSPIVAGVMVVLAGTWQLTARKAQHLACCRRDLGDGSMLPSDVGAAWRFGVRLGVHCARCCANLMVIPLVVGVMDLRAMIAASVVITLERFAPAGDRVARVTGIVAICAGFLLIAQDIAFVAFVAGLLAWRATASRPLTALLTAARARPCCPPDP